MAIDAERAGRREANLRQVNERVVAAASGLGTDAAHWVHVLCECARDACNDTFRVPRTVFENARDTTTDFIVRDGHVLHAVERQLVQGDGWVMVRKHGEAARAATEQLS